EAMDAPTITWYRFAFAGLFVFTFLTKKRALPVMRSFPSNKGGYSLPLLFCCVITSQTSKVWSIWNMKPLKLLCNCTFFTVNRGHSVFG
ncbi:MAG: hypothetical protein ACI96W_003655, partial [Paraglaciecola sp.]